MCWYSLLFLLLALSKSSLLLSSLFFFFSSLPLLLFSLLFSPTHTHTTLECVMKVSDVGLFFACLR